MDDDVLGPKNWRPREEPATIRETNTNDLAVARCWQSHGSSTERETTQRVASNLFGTQKLPDR